MEIPILITIVLDYFTIEKMSLGLRAGKSTARLSIARRDEREQIESRPREMLVLPSRLRNERFSARLPGPTPTPPLLALTSPYVYPPLPPQLIFPRSIFFLMAFPPWYTVASTIPETAKSPPTMAHAEVRKCRNDRRLSDSSTLIGLSS